jgi:phosphoesterase RecJ-like protein
MKERLKQLIESAGTIFITSHISPDPDALSSLLLMGTALKRNFAGKEIYMVLEEEPIGLESFEGYKSIEFGPVLTALKSHKPDLLILLDGNNFGRFSRADGEKIRRFVEENDIRTVIIDHHEPDGKDEVDLYINQGSPASVQDVYEILFDRLGLDKPDGYARTTMLGLYADTGGFTYENKRHKETLKLADKLIGAGVSVEEISNLINQYSVEDLRVLAELAANTRHEDGYNYSFIRDEFVADWIMSGKTGAQLHKGTEAFVNNFVRNIGGRKWGFITYKNILEAGDIYSASFRAVNGTKDVSKIASALGGGGHKGASGAKFEAASVSQAIDKIKAAIDSN